MKRLLRSASVLIAATVIFSGLSFHARADDPEMTVDRVVYTVSDDEATVVRFEEGPHVAEIIIPSEVGGRPVRKISENAFGNADAAKITLPDCIDEIGYAAFAGSSIESAVIPASVGTIENRTFFQCTNLKSVVIHENVTSIGAQAFYKCSALESVYIPPSVGTIGSNAFKNSGVKTVYGVAGSAAAALAGFVPVPAFTGRQLALDADLTMIFYAVCPDGAGAPTVTFSVGGAEKTVEGVKSGYEYVFRFDGITPQLIGETITATLRAVGYDDVISETSVRDYLVDVAGIFPDDETLVSLVADTLAYGAAAQRYVDPSIDGEKLVNYGTALVPSAFVPPVSSAKNKVRNNTVEGFDFTSVGVRFENVNKLFVKFVAGDGFSVFFDGDDLTARAVKDGDGYVLYTDGIAASDFGKAYDFVLMSGETVVQTLTYSVDSMVAAKYDDPDENTAALARATYNYGVSARAYADSH